MSSAAQREDSSSSYIPLEENGSSALKQLAAERLAAHRKRRAVVDGREAQERREQAEAQAAVRMQARRDANRAEVHPDAQRVREAVEARYRESVSYREFLAAEARRAAEQAQAEAEVAARNAKAVAAAQRELLQEIEQWNEPAAETATAAGELFEELPLLEVVEPRAERAPAVAAESSRARRRVEEEPSFDFVAEAAARATFDAAQLQVRLHEEVELAPPVETFYRPSPKVPVAAEEIAELDEEIEFRLAPEFSELVLGTQPIPANIIEFPRELVAPRKARPRLAEGPLREDGTPEPQLRIFEVEPAQISAEPEPAALAEAPEWQGMMLGAGPAAESRTRISAQLEAQLHLDQQIYAASATRRAYAAGVDLLCVTAGFAGFVAMAVKMGSKGVLALPRPLLGGAAAASFVVFALMYALLFFTLNDATPGMRAARVAFCTFTERNPSRRAIRRRLVSTVLAICPLGLGLAWMLLDGDGLGWHDRMSRMYPREY